MSFTQSVFFGIFFLGIGLSGLACGPARPIEPEEVREIPPEPKKPVLQEKMAPTNVPLSSLLGVKALSAVNENLSEDHSSLNSSATFEGTQIFYTETFRLSPDSHLFFVWPKEALHSKIIQASFGYDVMGPSNKSFPIFSDKKVPYHPDQERFSIPIHSLFHDSRNSLPVPISEIYIQMITLDLTLADSSRVYIQIKFRARECAR